MREWKKNIFRLFAFYLTGSCILAIPAIAETGEKLSKVTIIYSDSNSDLNSDKILEIPKESNASKNWWKAKLEDYDNLSDISVSYETVENFERKEPVLISDNSRNDVIISSEPTPSVISDVQEGYFAFSTYGWGHCVGLSQNGANFYAIYGGWNYQDILFHYYPGTVLMNTGTAETEMIMMQDVPGNSLQQVSEIVNLEMGGSFSTEALKAQAVAVYTYIKYYNNDSHDLKGKPDPPQNVIDACASVLGEALYYDNQFAMTMFGASCGGITADAYDIFDMNLPYLKSVSSDYDMAYDPHYGDVVYFSIEEVKNRIQNAYHIQLSDNPENWIQLIEGNGGYVRQVVIDNQITVRGDAFRYELDLKSPKFTYIVTPEKTDEIDEISQDVNPDLLYLPE
ncbi:MAG: hypothetical protein K2G88_07685 [Oscillospiraceae bacterium]|nr:hypothetical protein [Oscillospiraceae bacterium]